MLNRSFHRNCDVNLTQSSKVPYCLMLKVWPMLNPDSGFQWGMMFSDHPGPKKIPQYYPWPLVEWMYSFGPSFTVYQGYEILRPIIPWTATLTFTLFLGVQHIAKNIFRRFPCWIHQSSPFGPHGISKKKRSKASRSPRRTCKAVKFRKQSCCNFWSPAERLVMVVTW